MKTNLNIQKFLVPFFRFFSRIFTIAEHRLIAAGHNASNAMHLLIAQISSHRESILYYSALLLILSGLAAASYNYRNPTIRYTPTTTIHQTDSAIAVQSIPETQDDEFNSLRAPLHGEIINSFCIDELIWSETLSMWQTHPGIDIAASPGEAVAAAADGMIVEAYSDSLYGNIIVLDIGNGRSVRYASLNTLQMVEVGGEVVRGEIISSAGTCIGESSIGSHVHMEYYENGVPTDPTPLIVEN